MALCNPLFIDCCRRQHSSLEVVVYSSDVGQIVELAYPTARGIRILPHCIYNFLNTHSTYWECFCALITGNPTPARFVDMVENGHIVHTNVVCHHHTNQCGFSIHLNEMHHTTMLTSNYPKFPTTGSIVDVGRLVVRFQSSLARTNLGHAEIAPFFGNYLGTLASRYPGHAMPMKSVDFATTCRARTHFRRHSAVFQCPRQRLGSTGRGHQTLVSHTRNSRNMVKAQQPAPSTGQVISIHERDLLSALAAGLSIGAYDAEGLLEVCSVCNRMFAARTLREHILQGCEWN
ncbi:hypothetical protein BS17DRAFT_786666 [Gyrodon lividus]|nr:hypothetical protein BS17DRAFT_786666 [Gyrodon lividus]